jgi:hypothetical protein
MRRLLRTLIVLVAAAAGLFALSQVFGSPVLASPNMRRLADSCWLPGILLSFLLSAVTCARGNKVIEQPAALSLIAIAALWCFEFPAMFIWMSLAIQLIGWGFIWGDNGPFFLLFLPHAIALVIAIAAATATSFKIYSRMATMVYVRAVASMTAVLWMLFSPYLLWFLASHGSLSLLL